MWVGEWVCKHYKNSGFNCGSITSKTHDSGAAFNATFIRVRRSGVDLSVGGDSGGPVFSGTTAYGIHKSGIGYDIVFTAVSYLPSHQSTQSRNHRARKESWPICHNRRATA